MTMNPADEAVENFKNEMDKLQAEVWSYDNSIPSVLCLFISVSPF